MWASLHALNGLGDLDVSAVVRELMPLFYLEDDWFADALPALLGQIGAPVLEPLRAYLADRTR